MTAALDEEMQGQEVSLEPEEHCLETCGAGENMSFRLEGLPLRKQVEVEEEVNLAAADEESTKMTAVEVALDGENSHSQSMGRSLQGITCDNTVKNLLDTEEEQEAEMHELDFNEKKHEASTMGMLAKELLPNHASEHAQEQANSQDQEEGENLSLRLNAWPSPEEVEVEEEVSLAAPWPVSPIKCPENQFEAEKTAADESTKVTAVEVALHREISHSESMGSTLQGFTHDNTVTILLDTEEEKEADIHEIDFNEKKHEVSPMGETAGMVPKELFPNHAGEHAQEQDNSQGQEEGATMIAVQIVKDTQDTRIGVRLTEDKTGKISISSIKAKGLCASLGLAVGDEIVSLNGTKCRDMSGVEEAATTVKNTMGTISIVAKRHPLSKRMLFMGRNSKRHLKQSFRRSLVGFLEKTQKSPSPKEHTQSKVEESDTKEGQSSQAVSSDKTVEAYAMETSEAPKETSSNQQQERNLPAAGKALIENIFETALRSSAEDSAVVDQEIEYEPLVVSDTNKCQLSQEETPELSSKEVPEAPRKITPEKPQETNIPAPSRAWMEGVFETSAPMIRSGAMVSEVVDKIDTVNSSDFDDQGIQYRPRVVSVIKETRDQTTGVVLRKLDNGYFFVHRIAPNSLFAQTKLKIGDEVMSVNGVDCVKLSTADVVNLFYETTGVLAFLLRRNPNFDEAAWLEENSGTETRLPRRHVSFEKREKAVRFASVLLAGHGDENFDDYSDFDNDTSVRSPGGQSFGDSTSSGSTPTFMPDEDYRNYDYDYLLPICCADHTMDDEIHEYDSFSIGSLTIESEWA